MKKTTIIPIILMALALTGCGHQHTWVEATCTSPKTCAECGEIEGDALGHTWVEATCASKKTCTVCKETEGEALEHTWAEASCTEPKTCSVCGATEGSALGHTWQDATFEEAKTCTVCGETEGEPVEKTVENYFMIIHPERYEEECGSLQETVDSLSEYYKDFIFELKGNEVAEGFVFQEGKTISASYLESIRESTLESVKNDFDVFEKSIGIRPSKISYVFYDSDMNLVIDYTVEE